MTQKAEIVVVSGRGDVTLSRNDGLILAGVEPFRCKECLAQDVERDSVPRWITSRVAA
jgi:hypothetical protein